MADDAGDAAGEDAGEQKIVIPDVLNLRTFFPMEHLSDCTIKLPAKKGGDEGEGGEGEGGEKAAPADRRLA